MIGSRRDFYYFSPREPVKTDLLATSRQTSLNQLHPKQCIPVDQPFGFSDKVLVAADQQGSHCELRVWNIEEGVKVGRRVLSLRLNGVVAGNPVVGETRILVPVVDRKGFHWLLFCQDPKTEEWSLSAILELPQKATGARLTPVAALIGGSSVFAAAVNEAGAVSLCVFDINCGGKGGWGLKSMISSSMRVPVSPDSDLDVLGTENRVNVRVATGASNILITFDRDFSKAGWREVEVQALRRPHIRGENPISASEGWLAITEEHHLMIYEAELHRGWRGSTALPVSGLLAFECVADSLRVITRLTGEVIRYSQYQLTSGVRAKLIEEDTFMVPDAEGGSFSIRGALIRFETAGFHCVSGMDVPPRLRHELYLMGSEAELKFMSLPCCEYDLEWSGDLNLWKPLGVAVAGTGSQVTARFRIPENLQSTHFVRVVSKQDPTVSQQIATVFSVGEEERLTDKELGLKGRRRHPRAGSLQLS